MDYTKRLVNAQKQMERQGIDCMIVSPSCDMKYLTGYPGSADERLMAAVFPMSGEPFIIANRLCEAALANVPYRDIVYWSDGEDSFAMLASEISRRRIGTGTIAVDNELAGGILVPVLRQFPGSRLTLTSDVTGSLRLYKDREEMEAMRAACRMASEALRITMEKGRYWIGHTEEEVSTALVSEMIRQGIERGSAAASVGVSSSDPHHYRSSRVIEDNMPMWIDFGGIYHDYQTDMTRTFWFGEPDPEYVKLVNIVNEAREAGIRAAKVGNPLGAVDDAARGVIDSYGYGQYFTHRTGHGIGIRNHEGPSAGRGETTPIAPGMAFTCEPGIYIPGKWGVRVEDQLLADENGTVSKLHDFPTELTVFRR